MVIRTEFKSNSLPVVCCRSLLAGQRLEFVSGRGFLFWPFLLKLGPDWLFLENLFLWLMLRTSWTLKFQFYEPDLLTWERSTSRSIILMLSKTLKIQEKKILLQILKFFLKIKWNFFSLPQIPKRALWRNKVVRAIMIRLIIKRLKACLNGRERKV